MDKIFNFQISMNSSQGKRCLDSRQFVPKGIPVEGMSCHGLKGAQVRNKEDSSLYAHFTDIFVILDLDISVQTA